MLTGERGVGKTHLCRQVVEEARRRGYSCAGLLSPAVFEDGEKAGITLLDLATEVERPLAVADDEPGELRWGRYRFLPSTLEWAGSALRRAAPCHLLVIDELGPLELKLGQGLVEALNLLDYGAYSLALVVVRAELVGAVLQRLRRAEVMVVEVTIQRRDELPSRILSMLEEQVHQPCLPFGEEGCIVDS